MKSSESTNRESSNCHPPRLTHRQHCRTSPLFFRRRTSVAMAGIVSKAPELAAALLQQAKPKFAVFMKYAKVELAPPTPGDIPKAIGGVRNIMSSFRTGRYKQLSVREAWLNTMVALEVSMWFFVGECIGRRHLVGYNV